MSPTDEQIALAAAAYDETWRQRPNITVKNFAEARKDSMRAALKAVLPPPKDHPMSEEALVKRLKELQKAVATLKGDELWIDDNSPWRIMLEDDGRHKAVAEQHPESAPDDGEWADGKAICEIVNNAIKIASAIDTILAALSQTAREGMVLVPREPGIDQKQALLEGLYFDKFGQTKFNPEAAYNMLIETASFPAAPVHQKDERDHD